MVAVPSSLAGMWLFKLVAEAHICYLQGVVDQVIDQLHVLSIEPEGHAAIVVGSAAPADHSTRPDGPDEMTCAICLEQVDPVDMATIKGCEHLYCGEMRDYTVQIVVIQAVLLCTVICASIMQLQKPLFEF